MLSNAYFLEKIGFGTAENEPAKNLQILLISGRGAAWRARRAGRREAREEARRRGPRGRGAQRRAGHPWLSQAAAPRGTGPTR